MHGTSCASCEVVLEREIRKIPGVVSVEASHGAGKVTVTVADGVRLTTDDLARAVGTGKYRFSEGEGKVRTDWSRVAGAALLVVVLYLAFDRLGILRFSPDVSASAGYGAVFVVGIVAAFSSCTAVVGGLIAAVSARYAATHVHGAMAQKMRPHVLFNVGRIVGFAGFGALVGLLGGALQLSTTANGVLVTLVALLMIGLGVQLMGVFPAGAFAVRPPKWLSHRIHSLSESDRPWVPLVLGALTFFLPCGFTQSMQLYALSTGSPVTAALVMTVFVLGTTPALLGVGYVTSAAKGVTLKRLTQLIGAVVVTLGIANVTNGATLLGFVAPSTGATAVQAVQQESNEQIIEMEIGSSGYAPSTLRVKVDVPVRWEIYGDDFMGCASTLVMPAFNIQKNIIPGFNEIRFTPTKTGKFVFTCSMGMVRGVMIVER